MNRRGLFLAVFTPIYIAAAWLLLEHGSELLRLEESHKSLLTIILVITYIVISTSAMLAPYSDKTINRNGSSFDEIASRLSSIRNTPLFTDEIDILIDTMLKMQKNLKIKNAELVESREKMQELARTTLRSQESERRHISRELHDQAGQLLVSLRFTVQSLISDLPSNHGLSPQQESSLNLRLSSMLTQIDKTLETVRALSHKMRPALLDVGDINLAMQEYCTEFQEGKKITIKYEGAPLPFLAEDTAIAFFRFLQESLTNVLKHADASYVRVRLTSENGWVKMSVEDNGRGEFAGSSQKGIGILGMKERFLLLGGTVETRSIKNGFIITACAPYTQDPLS